MLTALWSGVLSVPVGWTIFVLVWAVAVSALVRMIVGTSQAYGPPPPIRLADVDPDDPDALAAHPEVQLLLRAEMHRGQRKRGRAA